MGNGDATSEKNKTSREVTHADIAELLRTLKEQIARERAQQNTERDIQKEKEQIKARIHALNKQVAESLDHGSISESEAWELRQKMMDMVTESRKYFSKIPSDLPLPSEKKPIKPTPIPSTPTSIETQPIGDFGILLNNELRKSESVSMSREILDFVMTQEWSIALSLSEEDNRWKNVWFIRDWRVSYTQWKDSIPTPEEALTIDPGIDLGQTSKAQIKEYFSWLLSDAQLQRLVDLTTYAQKNHPLKNIPPEFADLSSLKLTPSQVKIMAIRCYKKRWVEGIKTSIKKWYVGMWSINTAPEWVRAAFASKFVHRWTSWITSNLFDYIKKHDLGVHPDFQLSKWLDELKKTKPDWYTPQLIQIFNLGIPLPKRAYEEYKKYISWATSAQKNAHQVWLKKYEASQGSPENIIQNTIAALRKNDKLPNRNIEKSAWSVYDLRENKSIAQINEKEPMRAASMIKPFVALAYLLSRKNPITPFEKEKVQFIIDYDPKKLVSGKIAYGSSNAEKANYTTTQLMQAVKENTWHQGTPPEAVMAVLTKYLPKEVMNGVSIVETIPTSWQTYKNTLTTWSVMEFYKFIYQNKTVEPYKTLLALLMTPKRDAIADETSIPTKIRVANKSGYTGLSRGDGGIIFAFDKNGNEHPYIFVGMFSRNNIKYNATDGKNRSNVIRTVSGKIYSSLFPSS